MKKIELEQYRGETVVVTFRNGEQHLGRLLQGMSGNLWKCGKYSAPFTPSSVLTISPKGGK